MGSAVDEVCLENLSGNARRSSVACRAQQREGTTSV